MSVCGRKQKFRVTAMLLIFMTGLLMENQKTLQESYAAKLSNEEKELYTQIEQ